MRKFCWGLILVLLLLPAGCGGTQTAAEAYLAEHSEAELGEYFAKACFFTEDYASPKECSEWDLFRFAVFNGLEDIAEYDEATQNYRFTTADLATIFDRYFVEWEFDPAFFGEDYDSDTQEIVTIIGFGGDLLDYEFVNAEAVGDDEVEVRLKGSFNQDVPPEEPEGLWTYETVYSDEIVRAKLVGGEAKFVGYQRRDR